MWPRSPQSVIRSPAAPRARAAEEALRRLAMQLSVRPPKDCQELVPGVQELRERELLRVLRQPLRAPFRHQPLRLSRNHGLGRRLYLEKHGERVAVTRTRLSATKVIQTLASVYTLVKQFLPCQNCPAKSLKSITGMHECCA